MYDFLLCFTVAVFYIVTKNYHSTRVKNCHLMFSTSPLWLIRMHKPVFAAGNLQKQPSNYTGSCDSLSSRREQRLIDSVVILHPTRYPTTQFFTDRMPFLQPNQHRQSTEGNSLHIDKHNHRSIEFHPTLHKWAEQVSSKRTTLNATKRD